MSSMPRAALKTKASKPGVIGVPNSRLSALARAISSGGSEMSAGVILFITSAAVKPSIRSAPTLKIWMTPFASVAMLEKLALLKIALCRAPACSSASSACLRGVVGADQQIADDGVLRVAQRRDRHHRREAAAVLADVGQLVDVLDPARGLEHQCLEARRNLCSEFDAQRLSAGDHFLRIGNVGRRDLVHHFGGGVAQHALRADVEDLADAIRVSGDAGEVSAVENRALQGPRLELGADQQIADNGVLRVAQRRDGHDRGKAAAILSNVGQFVNVL